MGTRQRVGNSRGNRPWIVYSNCKTTSQSGAAHVHILPGSNDRFGAHPHALNSRGAVRRGLERGPADRRARAHRESFLTEAGEERDDLARSSTVIDGAYSRINELLKSGVVSVAGTLLESKVLALQSAEANHVSETGNGASARRAVRGRFAVRRDDGRGGGGSARPPEPHPGTGSQYAETLDSTPAGESPATSPCDGDDRELRTARSHRPGWDGVVFKARHTRIDRLAAIKMVLAAPMRLRISWPVSRRNRRPLPGCSTPTSCNSMRSGT